MPADRSNAKPQALEQAAQQLHQTRPRRFRAYPAYKASGVEWLGDVPEHWVVRRLKTVTRFAYGDSLLAENRENGDIPVFGSNGVVGIHDVANTIGPTIIIGRKGSFGKVNYSEHACFAIDTTFYVNENATQSYLRWLYYLLQWMRLDSFSKDSAVPGLAREDAYAGFMPLPPLAEQQAIARFLDEQTQKIDELIEAKRRLLELLKEKRQAVITHVVTKGLDPNVRLKPSGIDWLGDVPEHWEVKRLRHISSRAANGVFKQAQHFGSGNRIVNVSDVYREDFFVNQEQLERVQLEEGELNCYIVGKGDIFFVRSSLKLEGVGRTVCIDHPIEPTVFECHLIRSSPDQARVNSHFLINFLNSQPAVNRLVSLANCVTMATIGQEKIKSLEILLPPLHEQNRIIEKIEHETEQAHALAEQIQDAISRLLEYRSVLISAAVTGKIDVSGV